MTPRTLQLSARHSEFMIPVGQIHNVLEAAREHLLLSSKTLDNELIWDYAVDIEKGGTRRSAAPLIVLYMSKIATEAHFKGLANKGERMHQPDDENLGKFFMVNAGDRSVPAVIIVIPDAFEQSWEIPFMDQYGAMRLASPRPPYVRELFNKHFNLHFDRDDTMRLNEFRLTRYENQAQFDANRGMVQDIVIREPFKSMLVGDGANEPLPEGGGGYAGERNHIPALAREAMA